MVWRVPKSYLETTELGFTGFQLKMIYLISVIRKIIFSNNVKVAEDEENISTIT